MADTRDLPAEITPCILYSSVNSNIEIICGSLLFFHKLNLCVISAQWSFLLQVNLFVLTHLNTVRSSLTVAVLMAVQRHRIKIEIVRSLDSRCSTVPVKLFEK